MQAAVIESSGLVVREVPTPRPGPGQILVKVAYAGLNRADLGMAAGHKHGAAGGAGTVAGLEWSGIVAELGDGTSDFSVGERVMGSGAGAYAEYVIADGIRASRLPDTVDGDNGYSLAEAATLPVALQTMHDALATNGRLRKGESVFIQGASSGVGILGLQIAKHLGAGLVMGSSTNPERRARLTEVGADLAIDTTDPDWPDAVQAATDRRGVDLIVDQVSAGVANDNMKAAAILGRIVNVGRLGGTRGEFDFNLHALKRIDYIGVTFRTRTREEVKAIIDAMRADLGQALAERRFQVPIDTIFPLDNVFGAQAHMADNRHFGKILLSIGAT